MRLILMLIAVFSANAAIANAKPAEAVDSLRFDLIMKTVEAKNFIVEADRVTFDRGRMVNVSSSTNFISVKDDRAVIQVAPMTAAAGINGVGGVTVDGMISDYDVRINKRGSVNISFNVMGSSISANVSISLPKNGDRVSVRISGNFNSKDISLSGLIMPTFESRVFQGMTL